MDAFRAEEDVKLLDPHNTGSFSFSMFQALVGFRYGDIEPHPLPRQTMDKDGMRHLARTPGIPMINADLWKEAAKATADALELKEPGLVSEKEYMRAVAKSDGDGDGD